MVLLACMSSLLSHDLLLLSLQVYTLGTILSMQISFVGFQPVQSSEHMAVSSTSFDSDKCAGLRSLWSPSQV